ncbi:CAP domain-containing protein [Salegentibacter sp. HM20]
MRKGTFRLILPLFFGVLLSSCAADSIDEELKSIDHTVETSSYEYSEIESGILSAVNAHRVSEGLTELKPLAEISVEAYEHSAYMAENKTVNHDNFGNRYSALVSGVGAKAVSENVAYGYRTAEAVVKAWMNSEGHKKNIEGAHTHFGVAVEIDEEGRNYFTQIFIKR